MLSAFAGLRPLVKSAKTKDSALVPRDHVITVSDSGLVTITGGKWTTYRQMAEDTVDRAAAVAGLEGRPCQSSKLRLHGAAEESKPQRPEVGQNLDAYGSDLAALLELMDENAAWAELLHPRLPYRVAEVIWAVRQEMARTVEDVLSRRTRSLLLDARASMDAAPKAARWMARELGQDEKWQQDQVAAYRKLAEAYLV